MASKESITPSKTSISIQFTPSTKKSVCINCGKREEKDKYKTTLYKNNEKTGACDLIETYLGIQVSPLLHVDSLCQNCHRSLLTLQTKVTNFQRSYQRTVETLKKTHGKTSKKRLPFSVASPESKRRSIDNQFLPGGANDENESTDKTARVSF